MNRLELPGNILHIDGKSLEPKRSEKNPVGFCSRCGKALESIAYHRSEDAWLISASCEDKHLVLLKYDFEWNWISDLELEVSCSQSKVSDLDKEKLEAVFTPAEIRTLISCERGEAFTRQNLYRARAKYEKFEKLFGVKINL